MAVFSALEIVPVMHICGNQMKGLTKYLFHAEQTEEKQKYLLSCEKVDDAGINHAIDAAFCRLMKAHSTREGLIKFVDKFPELHIEVDGEIFEKDIIIKIAEYGDKMLQIIDNNSDLADRN
ncbi:MAG: hypothetical protein K2M91_16230 [Lachnospiraceae bacterium]|nr:hypothetical protein [Lachnospiraceae bacterium]